MQETSLSKQQVIDYLNKNTDFFIDEKAKSLLSELKISQHLPAGVSSFVEKQSEVLRSQNEKYKSQLLSLTTIAKENESLWQTLKSLCVFTLSKKQAIISNPQLLIDWLKENYQLSMVTLKLPSSIAQLISHKDPQEYKKYQIDNPEMKKELMSRVSSGCCYCDNRLPKNIKHYLFAENTMRVGSCAIIPLNLDDSHTSEKRGADKGILVLADETETRFHNHVDMTYLNMLSDILTAVFIQESDNYTTSE